MNAKKTRDRFRRRLSGRLLLGALSLAYVALVSARRALYGTGLLKSRKLPVPVVCFGNISAGGTGKTSLVVLAAAELRKAGYNPAILIRGYKRRAPADRLVVLSGDSSATAEEAGDEAVMIFNALRGLDVPVMVSSDRVSAGLAAVERFKSDILLMDDGYQFFRLRRDRNIVLINATAPFHKDRLLPLGDLRETSAGLRRADAAVLSHCERVPAADILALREEIGRIAPSLPVLESMHSPKAYINAFTGDGVPLSSFRGKKVAALSGIGDPKSFEDALARLKAVPAQIWRYPDHHRFTRSELSAVQSTRGGMPLVTTYKDFARFPDDWREILTGEVFILSVRMTFRDDGLKRLMEMISL